VGTFYLQRKHTPRFCYSEYNFDPDTILKLDSINNN